MSKLIDRTGEIYNGLQIVKELGHNKVEATCLKCGATNVYDKNAVVYTVANCKTCSPKFVNRTGQVYNGLKITKELMGDQVEAICLKCNKSNVYLKSALIKNQVRCKSCSQQFVDRTGEVHLMLKITKELMHDKVEATCLKCGKTDVYNKAILIRNEVRCKHCSACFVSRLGQEYNNLKVIKELENSKVIAQCLKCGAVDNYNRGTMLAGNAYCKNCRVGNHLTYKRIENHNIKNVTVIRFEYTGRDAKPYYTCKCNKCGEELMLNYDEIFTYECTK